MQNLRKLKTYKELTAYLATARAEGFCEGENASKTEQLSAWQYLVDTGLAWQLQGWFGRTATELISNGLIKPQHKRRKKTETQTHPKRITTYFH